MSWTDLSTQFALELAFGVLVALCFVTRAPLGTLFHRLMGTTAGLALVVALALSIGARGRAWTDPVVLSILVALAAYPIYSGPLRGKLRLAATGVALVASASGIAFLLAQD